VHAGRPGEREDERGEGQEDQPQQRDDERAEGTVYEVGGDPHDHQRDAREEASEDGQQAADCVTLPSAPDGGHHPDRMNTAAAAPRTMRA
jgi:hypothetical protein